MSLQTKVNGGKIWLAIHKRPRFHSECHLVLDVSRFKLQHFRGDSISPKHNCIIVCLEKLLRVVTICSIWLWIIPDKKIQGTFICYNFEHKNETFCWTVQSSHLVTYFQVTQRAGSLHNVGWISLGCRGGPGTLQGVSSFLGLKTQMTAMTAVSSAPLLETSKDVSSCCTVLLEDKIAPSWERLSNWIIEVIG